MGEKKGISNSIKVQYGGTQDLAEVAHLLERIASSLKENGTIPFLCGDTYVELILNQQVNVEYEYEVEAEEHSFEIELKWKGKKLDSKKIIK